MLDLIQNQILFFLALAFVTFLPGYCLVLAIFKKSGTISTLERFIVSFGSSIISLDFILFSYSGLHIAITRLSVILGILVFSGICLVIYKLRRHSELDNQSSEESQDPSLRTSEAQDDDSLFSFSKNQFILILLLLFLTVFIKTAYLSGSIAPTPTDLGHHLYWSKLIADTHQLTNYEGLPDFIIGEHTVFASIYLLTGLNFFTGWPVVILYLINLLGILTVFILTLRIFRQKVTAILTLFFLGVLYAISSPQAKYVSGGVMGNIFGDYLMPLAIYFYYRSFEFLNLKSQYNLLPFTGEGGSIPQSGRETDEGKNRKNSITFLALAVFTTVGLFYTHHLTAFILLLVFALLIPMFVVINYKDIKTLWNKAWPVIFSPKVLATLAVGFIFFFFIFTPSYVNTKAIGTAVGSATKNTRIGLSIANLKQTVGEPRLALGFLGLLILLISFRRRNFGYVAIAAWAIMIFIMSVFPKLLFVNLPSERIGNYLSYPLAILSAYALYAVFRPESCQLFWGKKFCENSRGLTADKFLRALFLVVFIFAVAGGMRDTAQAFKKTDSSASVNQTFDASRYLAANNSASDEILKDHNYITSDSWIKIFFMRGYKYPASRGLFSRYSATGNRNTEVCTLTMISNPGSDEANECFSDTKTDFIMINPKYDSAQFQKLTDFNQVYFSPEIAIYYKKN